MKIMAKKVLSNELNEWYLDIPSESEDGQDFLGAESNDDIARIRENLHQMNEDSDSENYQNGLHAYPRHQPSLGILNKLIGQDSNSPLIVLVDSNNQVTTLNDERDLGQEQKKGRHVHNPSHQKHAAEFSEREYENALYELLRTSEKMLEKQLTRSSKRKQNAKNSKNSKNGKNGKSKGNKKDSCENEDTGKKQEFLAEQCSKSENSCEFDGKC